MLRAARYFQLKGVDVLSDNLTEPKRGARRGTLRDGPPSARIRRNSMPAYPFRPPMWWIFRIPCAAFGALGLIGVLQDVLYRRDFNTFAFQFLGGGLVAVAWGTFGVYGGFPLVDTVKDWQPPTMPDEITQKHRDGLRVIRRRRWAFGLSFPGYFVLMIAALAIAPNAMEAVFPVVAAAFFTVIYRYYYSRCPRCGYGFFAGSTKRYATVSTARSRCRNCRLERYAYRQIVTGPSAATGARA
jgi:hypothetical protein